MLPYYDLIVVIPVGPGTKLDYLTDTMDSVRSYVPGSVQFILVDDSQRGTTRPIRALHPEVDVLPVTRNRGKVGGLYISLSEAFHHAYKRYDFQLLLRLDDDALVIGPGALAEAQQLLESSPDAGIIGRRISGRFSPDEFGNLHDNAYPRNTLLAGTCSWKAIRRPLVNATLRSLLLQAFQNGYELGENIQGGAYFITRKCIRRLLKAGFLPLPILRQAILCEDHLFSLLTKAVGLDLVDFSAPGEPFACAWKGLSASPETLLQHRKKIIHSVRFWDNLDQDAIRSCFRAHRQRECKQGGGGANAMAAHAGGKDRIL